MKSIIKSLLLISFAMVVSCNNSYKKVEVINYRPADTLINEIEIINEIEKSLNLLDSGITYQDADLIFSIFGDNPDAKYVRDGHIYEDWNDARKEYAKWFNYKGAKDIKKDFIFRSKQFDIINPNTVLFTGLGSIYTLPDTKNSWDIAYTILWINTVEGWQAANMHISWENK